jgi:phenylacetate-CoA ligase
MHSWLVPRVVMPLHDRVTGRRLWTTVEELRRRQWSSADTTEARAVARARKLLVHAETHVPHYRALLREAGVSSAAMQSVADLGRVPITTKEMLRRGFPAGVTADNLSAGRRLPWLTSGSTGLPLAFFLDRAAVDDWTASYLFFLEWAGTALWHTRVLIANPRHYYVARTHPGPLGAFVRRAVLGHRQLHLPGPDLTADSLVRTVARVARRRPYFLWAYASYAGRLAGELLDQGLSLPVLPRAVFSLAETLTLPGAAAAARAFRTPITNHYSCLEIPRIAQTCPDYPDVLHVNAERAIVRVVDDAGQDVAPGERGRVIVTDLVNEVMPFINYDLGDTARVGAPCACGRGWPTLAAIEGRTGETLATSDGRAVSAGVLGQFLLVVCDIVPYVWEYQAVQDSTGATAFRVIPTARYTTAVGETLRRQLETLLGPETRVRVEPVGALERTLSGKRFVIRSATRDSGDGTARVDRAP